ncbi:DNA polymerase IV [Phaeacidiphilus oryzae]|uniref:DNA polymerase IV n=1 Tax=Phaeacidiphilus oryzae TaxID=348818 RepID=UPI000564B9A3|nr:DNA polymerase IV [Phaeacidiphilus oryzae]
MRPVPSILHLDMDAFFASVEQASKPSLRGKPVIVGGLGARGVVSTASYEARVFGVHSAMAMAHARRLAPNAAYLVPRFALYREVSETVMGLLRAMSPLVEPLSLDEAFVDLAAGPYGELIASAGPEAARELVQALGEDLRADITAATGLTGSVGLAGAKFLAKIASERAKPDGLVLIEPGTERELLDPLSVRVLPGVGPATAETLRRAGLNTVGEIAAAEEVELIRLLGKAHGAGVHALAQGIDDRPVVAERDAKSISVEDTFEVDLRDRDRIVAEVERLAERCVGRLRAAGRSGRTVVLKVRRYDFSTLTRSETLRGPTDDPGVVTGTALRMLDQLGSGELAGGVRLLGVGVSGLADFTQEDLFAQAAREAGEAQLGDPGEGAAPAGGAGEPAASPESESTPEPAAGAVKPAGEGVKPAGEAVTETVNEAEDPAYGGFGQPRAFHPGREPGSEPGTRRRWLPGEDVRHEEFGPGWVQGSGVGRVTVRFETPESEPGRVRTFREDDPALAAAPPLSLVSDGDPSDGSA